MHDTLHFGAQLHGVPMLSFEHLDFAIISMWCESQGQNLNVVEHMSAQEYSTSY